VLDETQIPACGRQALLRPAPVPRPPEGKEKTRDCDRDDSRLFGRWRV